MQFDPNKYLILKTDDIQQHLSPNQRIRLGQMARRIEKKREAQGKQGVNTYLVVNMSDEYSGQVLELMKKNSGIVL